MLFQRLFNLDLLVRKNKTKEKTNKQRWQVPHRLKKKTKKNNFVVRPTNRRGEREASSHSGQQFYPSYHSNNDHTLPYQRYTIDD